MISMENATVTIVISTEPIPRFPDYILRINIEGDEWVPDLFTFYAFLEENPNIAKQFVSWLTGKYPTDVKFEMTGGMEDEKA